MSIELNDQQFEIKDSFAKFLAKEVKLDQIRNISQTPLPKLWPIACEFGLPTLFADKEAGIRELGVLAYEAGYFLAPEQLVLSTFAGPYFWNTFLTQQDTEWAKLNWESQIADLICSGQRKVALAAGSIKRPCVMTVRKQTGISRIDGVVENVACYPDETQYLLLRALDSDMTDCLYLCNLKLGKEQQAIFSQQASLDISTAYTRIELRNVGALALANVKLEQVWQQVAAILANELAGMAAKLVAVTVEYCKTRKQFARPIGSFQAVQHRLADMHLQAQAVKSLANFASWSLAESQEQASIVTKAAIAYACEQVPLIAEGAIQLHGGIGFTWECDLHLYLRRAKMYELQFAADQNDYQQIVKLVGQF